MSEPNLNPGETLGPPVNRSRGRADIEIGRPLPPYPPPPTWDLTEEAANTLQVIKERIKMLFFGRRQGQCASWWKSMHEEACVQAEAQLEIDLAAWKSEWTAKKVDVAAVFQKIWKSSWGRIFETDPAVHELAHEWALKHFESQKTEGAN